MRNLRILVTGASGFVGGHLVVGLAKENYEVLALVNKNQCPAEVVKVCSNVIQVDLVNDDLLSKLKATSPDIIIHAAALAKPEQCEKNPELAHQVNKVATERLLSSFNQVRNPQSRFIYISTDLVFDGNDSCPVMGFEESDEPNPRSVYAQTKREGEKVVLSLPGDNVVTRICLVYGNSIGNNEGFLGWLKGGIASDRPVQLFSDEYRTPVSTAEITEAMSRLIDIEFQVLLEKGQQIFHFAGLDRISRYEFGQKFCETFGFKQDNILCAKRADAQTLAPRPADVSLNSEQTRGLIGHAFQGVADSLVRLRP